MAAASAVKEALWLRKIFADLDKPMQTLNIYTDNQASLAMLKNPISTVRTKHIDVLHHFARERVALGDVNFTYIATTDNLADTMTKPIPKAKFDECCLAMGIC